MLFKSKRESAIRVIRVGRSVLKIVFEAALFLFIFLLFLSLNSDTATHVEFRTQCGWWIAGLSVLAMPSFRRFIQIRSFAFLFFSAFAVYELVRLGWGQWVTSMPQLVHSIWAPPAKCLPESPRWFFFYAMFCMGYFYFRQKSSVTRLFYFMAFGAWALAMSATFNILTKKFSGGWRGQLFPQRLFRIHPWLNDHVLVAYTHPNYVGDLLASGFFCAIGMAFYQFRKIADLLREKIPGLKWDRPAFTALLFLVVGALITMVIFFLQSRGTMLCFITAFFLFCLVYGIKFRGKQTAVFALSAGALILVFLLWSGNLGKAINDLGTLHPGTESYDASTSVNLEGAKRAVGMYKVSPVWGIGTTCYIYASKNFYSEEAIAHPENYILANADAMNHYLQLLAEEGTGAFIYYLFMLGYAFDFWTRIVKVKSRFQFVTALSLFCFALMVLFHAALNPLMQHFSLPVLVYISMGASLAILEKDFAADL